MAYTAFISYNLVSTGLTAGGSGYSQTIHCNYIKSVPITTEDPYIQEINFNFPNVNVGDFKFLTANLAGGTGYSANEIHALVQVVNNNDFDNEADIKPASSAWKQYDITSQVTGYTAGTPLTGADLTSVVFRISLLQYENATIFKPYNLDYLNYPTDQPISDDDLCFGASTFFLGNVTTEINAIAYTTDLSISLPLSQFNTSSNLSWDEDIDESVVITEIGIYDVNKNLVGIGKLNNPILKDDSIARTIVFAIDF